MGLREDFERTKCDCLKCQAGCKHKPGMLIPEDLRPLAAHLLDKPVGEVSDKEIITAVAEVCEASDGALVQAGARRFRIPTIVPRLTKSGCIFFEDGKCKIHEVAPFGCSHVDLHMGRKDGDARSYKAHEQIMLAWGSRQSNNYRLTWTACKLDGHNSLPLQVKAANFQQALDKIEEEE